MELDDGLDDLLAQIDEPPSPKRNLNAILGEPGINKIFFLKTCYFLQKQIFEVFNNWFHNTVIPFYDNSCIIQIYLRIYKWYSTYCKIRCYFVGTSQEVGGLKPSSSKTHCVLVNQKQVSIQLFKLFFLQFVCLFVCL